MKLSEKGLDMFFKPHQKQALAYLQSIRPEGANSREVCTKINETNQISRASVLTGLNKMVDDGILTFTEVTGKGGYHRVYACKYDTSELKTYLTQMVISKLLHDFPESMKVLSEH